MFASVHPEDTFSTRAQSAKRPTKQRSLTRTGEDEQYDTLRKTLNRLNEHCMHKFDEANAKLEEQAKEIAKRRLTLTGASKAAEKSKPKVTERKPVEKPKSSKQERPKRLVRNSSAGAKTTKSMAKFASP